MAHTIIRLNGSGVESIRIDREDTVRVRFAPALIVKSQGIAGVDPSTLWEQGAELTIRDSEVASLAAALPSVATGGSMEAGGFKYLDMVPLPMEGVPGFAELRLRFAEGEVVVTGQSARIVLEGQARYVEHIRETQPPA
ncbi:MAG: hypothetical protein MUF66_03360 [Gammaproteobacteria bacterium]|jgi:hypothetical protein|nr:hypothetical protein [Gammaproteobacteria bacterium]